MQIKCFSLAASNQHHSSARSSSQVQLTVITLLEVSVEYAEDCSAMAISRHGSCHTSKTVIIGNLESSVNLSCLVGTRQELNETGERET